MRAILFIRHSKCAMPSGWVKNRHAQLLDIKFDLVASFLKLFKLTGELEGRAFLVLGDKLDVSIVLVGNFLAYSKAQTNLLLVLKNFENLRLILNLNSYSSIIYLDSDLLILVIIHHRNINWAFMCISDSVLNDVNHDFL